MLSIIIRFNCINDDSISGQTEQECHFLLAPQHRCQALQPDEDVALDVARTEHWGQHTQLEVHGVEPGQMGVLAVEYEQLEVLGVEPGQMGVLAVEHEQLEVLGVEPGQIGVLAVELIMFKKNQISHHCQL